MRYELMEVKPTNAVAKEYRKQLLERMKGFENYPNSFPLQEALGHYERASQNMRKKMLKKLKETSPPNEKSLYYKIELLKMIDEFETSLV